MIDSPSTLPNSRMVTSQTLLSPKLQLSTCDFASMMKDVAKLPPRDVIKSNNYIPLPQTLKFPKGRRIRRATQSNIHDQTHSLQRKISRKMTERSFVDHIRGDNPEQSRRELMSGTFNKNKQPTHLRLYGVSEVQKRTISDLGVDYNRKKVKQTHVVEKRNPITQGDFSKKFSRQQLWKQDRRLRDNGKQAKNVLAWDTSKQTNSYATIHKNCLKSYHS